MLKILFSSFLLIQIIFASTIQTYQAKFTQSIKNSENKIISYDGEIYIKQPSKMLWKYKTPVIKNVYMNNLKVTIDEPELEQAIHTTLTNEINLIDFLNNPDLVDNKYNLTFEDNKLVKINYIDEMENNITVQFSSVKINTKIPDQLFQFIAPLDYDIIRK